MSYKVSVLWSLLNQKAAYMVCAMNYRPEIDGLRAVAVLPVIFFHAGYDAFSGGYAGVDVFFVISGYLITSILIKDLAVKKFSLAEFYERRARRILPALFLITFLTIIGAWLYLNPFDLQRFGLGLIGIASFSSNIVFWRTRGYFNEASELNPIIHNWSLAVEEQYYFFFPVFLLLVWRFGKKPVFWLIVAGALASFALSEWGWRNNAVANFYLSPTRAWELLAGSICAFILHDKIVKPNNTLSIAGLLAITLSVLLYDSTTPFPSFYTLLPVIGTCLLILFCQSGTHVARLLSLKWIVGIGLVSYSAYLWHQPLFVFARFQLSDIHLPFVITIGLTALTFALSYLSWRYVEQPFRNRNFMSRKAIFSLSLAGLIALTAIGAMSKLSFKNAEYDLAKALSENEYVYFPNINERLFTKARLAYPLEPYETLIVGSSRLMQISSDTVEKPALNLGVSGAAVEDYIAFAGEAVAKHKPKQIILGADPWLFNKYADRTEWQSIAPLVTYWRDIITAGNTEPYEAYFTNSDLGHTASEVRRFYEAVNLSGGAIANHNLPEMLPKKAKDGWHIYNKTYVNWSEEQVKQSFQDNITYAMTRFKKSEKAKQLYKDLIVWLQAQGIEVKLVLTPYHPDLYKRIEQEKPTFLAAEKEFRALSRDLAVPIVGSYNPSLAKCTVEDFYDGMHPNTSCMQKVLYK